MTTPNPTSPSSKEYNIVDDTIPLVTYARTPDSVWNLYIGGSVQVRETNAGLIQVRASNNPDWVTVGTKEVYA